MEERYAQLPLVTRAFLHSLTAEEVVNLKNILHLYDRFSKRPHVVRWLSEAREDEIELLDDGIRLLRAGSTVGKFVWWALATLIGAAILGTQAGEWFEKVARVFSGHK